MTRPTNREIFNEQWGDQLLHLIIGAVVTYFLCSWSGSLAAVILPAFGWIAWEHSQYPNHGSKEYDDASLDRFFQEAGLMVGAAAYLIKACTA